MASSSDWLGLPELSHRLGISTFHLETQLHQKGLRDKNGYPTSKAINHQIVKIHKGEKNKNRILWCEAKLKELISNNLARSISRPKQIQLWANLLQALNEGSPSINITPEQMSEDLPETLINDVNKQLKAIGCHFQINKGKNQSACQVAS